MFKIITTRDQKIKNMVFAILYNILISGKIHEIINNFYVLEEVHVTIHLLGYSNIKIFL